MATRIAKYKIELVKENSGNYDLENNGALTHPKLVADALNKIFNLENQTDEHFVMLCLNTKNKIIGAFEICIGTIDTSLVNVRGIIQRALLCNASRIMIAHNHPSGILEPSKQDITTTSRLAESGEILGIKVIDHLIISTKSYYSFREHGLM